jgi:predicted nuclease with TOPRIM domain
MYNYSDDELTELRKENKRLREDYALSWENHLLHEQIFVLMEAKVERLREALKPFADIVKGNWNEQPDTMPMSYGFGIDKRFDLTLGDFRKARATLKESE